MKSLAPRCFAQSLILAGCLTAAAEPALAASSQVWVLRNREDFRDAKLDGVALAADGTFHLSARVSEVMAPAQPNIWSLARDPSGRLHAGGGNDGRVYRARAGGGEPEVVLDTEELQVHALAFDSKGRLLAGTSPSGRVYRVEAGGIPVVIFDPEETYIWAMHVDARDRLYVATGGRGRVYRIDEPGPGAKAAIALDGREDHFRSLAAGSDGSIYAGSDQNGIIYRIAPDGSTSVVYDSPMREIASLLVVAEAGGGDRIYAAALASTPQRRAPGSAQQPDGGVTRIRVTAEDSGGDAETPREEPDQSQRPRQQRPPGGESFFGAVYKVAPNGYARKLWESREALPLSLAAWTHPGRGGGAADRVLVGTGDEGRVMLLDDTGGATDFVALSSQQVNALIPDGKGGFFAAASNLGQVVSIVPGAGGEGTVTSQVLDAGFTSSWGALSWTADAPRGSAVSFRVRTGDTERPDDSWSDWSAAYTDASGTSIDRPRARYLQWQATLKPGGQGAEPVLRHMQISYLQDNLPPVISGIDVMPPGVILLGGGGAGGGESENSPATRRAQNQPRRSFERGRRAVSWKTEDANNDELRFDVFFKAEDETLWKPLARNLEDEFHSWDATAMPDGVYRVKVTATDARSNPPGTALGGERVSLAFDVDNTPPQVGPIESTRRNGILEVSVTVSDSFSVVGDVAYSVDAAEWVPLLPADQIADAKSESYAFSVGTLEPGEHTITVRARDRAGNAAASKLVVRVENAR